MLNVPKKITVPQMPNTYNTFQYIGRIRDLKSQGRVGDITLYENDTYAYFKDGWQPLGVSNVRSDCVSHPKMCSQCGAPLFSCKCEYCGTMYGR